MVENLELSWDWDWGWDGVMACEGVPFFGFDFFISSQFLLLFLLSFTF